MDESNPLHVARRQAEDKLPILLETARKRQASNPAPASRLLTTPDAAKYLNLSPKTLMNWRSMEPFRGPRFIRFHTGAVRYDRDDLDAWIDDCRV